MAILNLAQTFGLVPTNIFLAGGVNQGAATATQKSYTFSVNGQQRTLVVTGIDGGTGTITAIRNVTLYGADGTTILAEFEDVADVALSTFEEAWLDNTATPNDVFSLLLGGGSILNGSARDDRFVGGTGDDTITGNSDYINFTTYDYVDYSHRSAAITVDFDNGDIEDGLGTMSSGQETETLIGIGGVYATAFNDKLTGDTHDNEFWGGLGSDTIDCGGSFDMIAYNGPEIRTKGIVATFDGEGSGVVFGETGEIDSFTGIEAVHGTSFGDSFKGAQGFQRFRGFGGNDTFDGAAGDDEVDYRNDIAESAGGKGVEVNLSVIQSDGFVHAKGPNGDTDRLRDIEFVRGTRNNDIITGSNGFNRLRGDSGNDILNGLGGDDRLEGGNGSDTLDGGDGRDFILGDAGNDILIGGAGFADSMEGGAGDDTIYGGVGTGGASNTNDRAAYNLGSMTGELDLEFVSEGEVRLTLTDGGTTQEIFKITRTSPTGNTYTVEDLRIDPNSNPPKSILGTDTVSNIDEILFYFPGRPNDSFRLQIGVSVYQHQDGYNIEGGFRDDVINANLIAGLKGTDAVYVFAGSGNDTITGHNGDNRLNGGDGNDVIVAGGGVNYITSDAGNDTIDGGIGWGGSMNYILSDDTFGLLGIDETESSIVFTLYDGIDVRTLVAATKNADGSWTDDATAIGHGIDRLTNIEAINVSIGGDFTDPAKYIGTTFGVHTFGDPETDGYRVNGTGGDDFILINEANVSTGIANNVVSAFGDYGNDTIIGHNVEDVLFGGDGNDRLDGGNGHDILIGDDGNDILDGGFGNDILIGGIGSLTDDDYFHASKGNNTIFGGSLTAGDNPDSNWNEIQYFNRGFVGIEVRFGDNGGPGTVQKREGETLFTTDTFYGIQAVLGTLEADKFYGGNTYGVQRFVGYEGNDLFDGTKGVNEVDYRTEEKGLEHAGGIEITAGITVDLGTGDTVTVTDLNGDTDTLTLIERVRGTENADTLRGNGLDNWLRSDKGDDILDGRDGNDRLEGGDGKDTITGGSGNDTIQDGAGNDSLDGGFGDDFIEGGGGDDTIDGGAENNNPDAFNEISYRSTATYGIQVYFSEETALAGVVVDDGSDGRDAFTNINAVHGSQFGDSFKGGTGNHRFIGHGGNDTFEGGSGNTEVDYRSEARAVGRTTGLTIDLAAGQVLDATGGVDTLINIKRIRGTDHADIIYGNALNNCLRGDGGNDIIMGRTGDDRIEGGLGNDTIIYGGRRSDYRVNVDNTGVLTIVDQRANGEGVDTVIDAEFFNFGGTTLNFAQVLNYGSGIDLSNGMVAENSKTGDDVGVLSVANPDATSKYTKYVLLNDAGGRFQMGADGRTVEVKNGVLLDFEAARTHTIKVQAIDEQMSKSLTFDLTVVLTDVVNENTVGSTTSDMISGGASTDTLSGGGGNDTLNAGGGNDKVDGGVGNDRILGDAGKDLLSGGAGKDVFAFASKDTGTSKTTADYITDFSGRGGDKIDLKLIDADMKKKGDQAFTFVGKNAFTKAGQVSYEKAGKDTYVYINTDSDKAAEGVIKVKGALDMQKAWFVL
jgi:Ca2+-binding RTX toxin-like protein